MFPKAKVKRFNEEVSCAPAPNAYDSKIPRSNAGVALFKSQRFEEAKYVTPGPGQYMVAPGLGAKKSAGISRSASFRIKKSSLADLTNCSVASQQSEIFRTPCSTPRKLRRSVSSCNLSSIKPAKPNTSEEVEDLKARVAQLESELAEARQQSHGKDSLPRVDASPTDHAFADEDKVAQLQAELQSCQEELRLQKQLVEEGEEERERLVARCEQLEGEGDRAATLSREVSLLNQDNRTLEEQLEELRINRSKAEEEVREVSKLRAELESRAEQEDARSIFLHFTQEQLNSQVLSLEQVVNSLRQENGLLNRGMGKLVASLQQEKQRLAELIETYTKENADSEVEFTQLQDQLAQTRSMLEQVKADSRELIINLRAQLAETEQQKSQLESSKKDLECRVEEVEQSLAGLEAELVEQRREWEVCENDKTVLRDSLRQAEEEKNGLALDLADTAKARSVLESRLSTVQYQLVEKEQQLAVLQQQLAEMDKESCDKAHQLTQLTKELEDIRGDLQELEMSKVGMEGEISSLREEVGQLEVVNCEARDRLDQEQAQRQLLNTRCEEQEELLQQNRELVAKLEELSRLQARKEQDNLDKMAELSTQVERLTEEIGGLLSEQTLLQEQISCMEAGAQEQKELLLTKQEALDREEELRRQLEEQLGKQEQKGMDIQQQMADLENNMEGLEKQLGQKEAKMEEMKQLLAEKEARVEELEESLLDTQELVACMEQKMEEAHHQHREEAERLCGDARRLQQELEEGRRERTSLLDMNNELSNQVSESLHAIASLQDRERSLGEECRLFQAELESSQEEMDKDRVRLLQVEDELLSYQAELETTVAELGQTEANRIQALQREEQLAGELANLKIAYNSAVEELTEHKTVGRQLLERLKEIEAEQNSLNNKLEGWKHKVEELEGEKALLCENIKHLEGLRDNLELNISDKISLLKELKVEMDSLRKEEMETKNRTEEVTKINLRLKGNLELRGEELRALRTELEECRRQILTTTALLAGAEDELKELKESKEAEQKEQQLKLREMENAVLAKAARVSDLEADRAEINSIRMKEIEMLIQLREEADIIKAQLQQAQVVAEEGESAKRSMEAQQRMLCHTEAKLADSEEALELWRKKLAEAEEVMKQMEAMLNTTEEENKRLQEMIEPFKEQLESFELEKKALLSRSEQAQGEVKKLATQYGALLGHQNQNQKIQHVVKLKQENVDLKAEVTALRDQLLKSKRNITKLEDRLNEIQGLKRFDPRLSFQPSNKENSMFSTPLPISREKHDQTTRSLSRSSTAGSPLRPSNRK